MLKHSLIAITLAPALAGVAASQLPAPDGPLPSPLQIPSIISDADGIYMAPANTGAYYTSAPSIPWGWGGGGLPSPGCVYALPAEVVIDRRFPFGRARDLGPSRPLPRKRVAGRNKVKQPYCYR